MINVELRGMKGLKDALKRKGEALSKGVDNIMADSVATINAEQKAIVPVDFGTLRSSLKFNKVQPLFYEIVSQGAGSEYAPYQEFGTGGLVTIPQGLEDEAMKYKAWSMRAQVNIKPQPFFYAPAFKEFKEMRKRIRELLSK